MGIYLNDVYMGGYTSTAYVRRRVGCVNYPVNMSQILVGLSQKLRKFCTCHLSNPQALTTSEKGAGILQGSLRQRQGGSVCRGRQTYRPILLHDARDSQCVIDIIVVIVNE